MGFDRHHRPAAGRRSPEVRTDDHDRPTPAERPPHAPPSATSTPGAAAGAEGDATMRDLLGGKGAGLAEMTNAGLPVPPGFTITTEACNDYFAPARSSRTACGTTSWRPSREVEQRDRQGLRRRRQPAARERPLGRQVLDAGDDGHGPQPRPQRGDAARARRADRQRALRLGRLPALHPDVRPDRHGASSGERFDHALEAAKQRPRRRRRTPTSTPATCASSSPSSRRSSASRHGPRLPGRPERAARPRDQGRLRSLVRQARPRLPQVPEDRPRPRHGGQRRDHGLRQHGRRLRHRRRLHARPEHRREGALRRVPDQRPGRGRRGRHPDRRRRSPRCRPRCPRSTREFQRIGQQLEKHYRDVQDLEFTIERGRLYMLQTRSRQAHRRGGREDRGRHGRRGAHHQGRGARPRSSRRTSTSSCATSSTRPRQGAPARRQGPQRVARRGRRAGRVQRRQRGRVGRAGREGRPRPRRDLARRLPRHGRGAGHPDRPRRRHVARRGRRPPDRQALRRRLRGAGRRLRARSPRARTTPGVELHARATGSASTARPARSSSASCRPSSARFEDQPELQKILGWADEIRRMGVWTNADKPEEAAQARSLRRPGHRPVPDRAHVPRGRAAGDRARRDPRRQPGDAGQGARSPPARR